MIETFPSLDSIQTKHSDMVNLLMAWSTINSSSDNLSGLAHMLATLEMAFSPLKGNMERISLPPRIAMSNSGELIKLAHGQALRITKRPKAKTQILLAGHMDTVYPIHHPFQMGVVKNERLCGPGVADMKGGLLIMLTALEALEKHPASTNIGWEVLINPDEEIGSVGSEYLFKEAAKRNDLGLIFEPSFADGALVSSRKGSMNVSIIARGKAAHAGRDFDKGHNAILGIADFISRANQLNHPDKGISINPGQIYGGGPVNIVPDFAICRLNARAIDPSDFKEIQKDLENLVKTHSTHGIQFSLYQDYARGPKIFDKKNVALFESINECAKEEGYSLFHRPSGGVCDGNILSEEGLTVIDTLGAIGGDIHTLNEYILINSLVERSRLTGRFLIKFAQGAFSELKKE